ncbi:DUF4856 domain-containing protein [Pollutibacter soli]|uniref:DUF4856 domain-containing protein n=1 Tax=Pollutibacter soli TaxID=3034157 RepID=UPI003013D0F0
MLNRALSLFIGAVSVLAVSCSEKDNSTPNKPVYTVPETYTFTNVDYKEAASRISMWVGYTGILGKSNVRQLSQDTINNLWNNTNSSFTAETASNIPYTFDQLNSLTTYNLASKTADAAAFKSLADSMVVVSQFYNTPASQGVAGKIGTRIFNYKGLEFNQAVAKGLMGGLTMNNIISILNQVPLDDNNTVVTGLGTAMEHHWDLAFGYVGIPADYDSSFSYSTAPVKADRPLGLGGYFAERGKFIQSGGKIYEAFRKGRAAISAKDYETRDEAIDVIKEYVEKTLAAAAYSYSTIPQTQTEFSQKFHSLSEGYGFILALKYRPATSPLTAANYQKLVDIFNTDFYELAADAANTKLKEAQNILTTSYGQLQP